MDAHFQALDGWYSEWPGKPMKDCFLIPKTAGFLSQFLLSRFALFTTTPQSQRADENMMIDTTLLVHFFGKKGKAELTFDDFYRYDDSCVKSSKNMPLIHPYSSTRHGKIHISIEHVESNAEVS